MKNKIPTAEEFLNETSKYNHINGMYEHVEPEDLIEFANQHVKAALESAANKFIQITDTDWQFKEDQITILNAYPKENIK